MTFDTFDTYNTDEAYKDKGTTAKGLVAAYKKDNPNGTKEDFYSKLNKTWAQDKDGHVKNAVDEAFKVETPKTEEKVTETKTETTAPKTTLDATTEDYMNKNNAIANAQEDTENERQSNELGKRWDARLANIDKMSQSIRTIDDHMIEQLPTFMIKRYADGEFGDPKSSDAKLRLAHFMINGVQSKLKNASNAAAIAAGRSPMFSDTQSDWEKYQQSNMAKGMENRWKKYEAETQNAIDLAKQGGMSEEAITDSIATISSNNRLQSAFNQMNERQKVFALKVLGEVGGRMGNMNDTEFANTLMGMAAMGDSLDYKEAAGMLIYRFIKDPEKRDAALAEMGLTDGTGVMAGLGLGLLGGGSGNKTDESESETGTTLEDGTKIDPGKYMNSKEYKELVSAADKLSQQYYNGEIDEAKFRSEYAKLEKIMGEHGWFSFFRNKGIKSADDLIKYNNTENLTKLDKELETLNNQANNGNIKPSDYNEKFNSLVERASKWGATEKYLKAINKSRVKDEAIIKASEKNAKKANKKK